ncbi:MAG: hypothetical protein JW797_05135 [Bradymonadales bacterium]|nr:hypothetical protein [Bradymonadales bacterium]
MQEPATETSTLPDRSSRSSWSLAALVYLSTRLPLVLTAWVIDHFRPWVLREGHFLYHGGAPHPNWLVDAFQKWDAYWFLNIVREGYHFHGIQEQIDRVVAGIPETNITPFPLYPLAIKALAWIVGDPAVAGLLVSQVCLYLSLVWLHRLASLDTDRHGADWVVWLFALVPWTYAFCAIYSESLFFLFTVGAVLAVRRGRYLLAGVAGLLASATRLMGILVAIPLALEYLAARQYRLRSIDWKILFLLLVPMGLLGYFAYLWWLTGEPLAYFVAQSGWHKQFVGFWHHPARWLFEGIPDIEELFHLLTVVAMGLVLYLGIRRIRWSYWIYAAIYVLVLLSSTYLLGLPRYFSGLFPLYLILGGLAQWHPAVGRVLLVLFAMSAPVVYFTWVSWSYAY